MSKFKVFTPTNGCGRLVTLQLSPVYETGEITFSPLRIIFIERIFIIIRSKELLLHMAGEQYGGWDSNPKTTTFEVVGYAFRLPPHNK